MAEDVRHGGCRALGRGCGSRRGVGSSCLHVAVDDFSRVAYAELLPDERKGTACASMSRCLVFFDRYNWERPHNACGACLPCRASRT